MLPSTMWQDITLPVRDARSLTDTVPPSIARRKSDFAVAMIEDLRLSGMAKVWATRSTSMPRTQARCVGSGVDF